jgi:hypothetical protein
MLPKVTLEPQIIVHRDGDLLIGPQIPLGRLEEPSGVIFELE